MFGDVKERPKVQTPATGKIVKIDEPKIKNAGTVTWYQQSVHKARHGDIHSEMKTVTPALAEVLLTRNADNRRIRTTKLEQMISDMKGGRWATNGEPIIISKTGELNDGQHRLKAIVESKVPVPMLFVFGVERETRTTLDQGAVRTAGDYLEMDGVVNSVLLASITRMVMGYERVHGASLGRRNEITPVEITRRAANDKTLQTSTRYAAQHTGRMKRYCAPTVLGFCHNILLREDAGEGVTFMDAFVTGEQLQRGDAVYAARERLLNLETRSAPTAVEIIFRAWNAYRERRQITKIPAHGRLPDLV